MPRHRHTQHRGILFSYKKVENPAIVTTWMDPQGIITLSEISQSKTNTDLTYYVELRKLKSYKQIRVVVARAERILGEDNQKIQISNYKINNFWRYNVEHDEDK